MLTEGREEIQTEVCGQAANSAQNQHMLSISLTW